MLLRLLQPQLPHLMAPYIDAALKTPTPPDVKLPTDCHQLHLIDTDEWEMKKAIAETGLQGGFEVMNRRWQNTIDNTRTPVERFKLRYPRLIHLFDLYFGGSDDQATLNQFLGSGQMDLDSFALALQQNLLHDNRLSHIRTFITNFNWLAGAISTTKLRNLFSSFPSLFWDCLIELGNDESVKISLQKYLRTSGVVDLERLLDDAKFNLLFDNYEVASLNASSGVLRHLGLRLDQVVMGASWEIGLALVQKKFPEYKSRTSSFCERGIVISFHDRDHFSFGCRKAALSYQPFKFAVPNRVPDTDREAMRRRLGVSDERKIIVVSSPDFDELSQILSAYRKLKVDSRSEPPLLILGMRDPNSCLEEFLRDEGLDAKVRDEKDQGNQKTWTATGKSVASLDAVILNTKGELMNLFAIADVAIVGHNRNLMEPAAQGVPILYADGRWDCNEMALSLLHHSGAAHVFDPELLHEQIRERLNEPDRYRDQGKSAFAILNEQLIPEAAAIAALAIGIQVVRNAPPKTAQVEAAHPKF